VAQKKLGFKVLTAVLGVVAAILLLYSFYGIGLYTNDAPDISTLAQE